MKKWDNGDTWGWGVLSIVLPPVLLVAPALLLAWLNIPLKAGEWMLLIVIALATMISYFGIRLIRAERRAGSCSDEILNRLDELQRRVDREHRVLIQIAEKQGLSIEEILDDGTGNETEVQEKK